MDGYRANMLATCFREISVYDGDGPMGVWRCSAPLGIILILLWEVQRLLNNIDCVLCRGILLLICRFSSWLLNPRVQYGIGSTAHTGCYALGCELIMVNIIIAVWWLERTNVCTAAVWGGLQNIYISCQNSSPGCRYVLFCQGPRMWNAEFVW